MALSPVMRMQIVNSVERVLHAPGNPGHDLQEMTFVLDYHMEKEQIGTLAKDVAGALKAHSQVFANVRCNLVHWKSDADMKNEVAPLAVVQLGRFLDDYRQTEEEKRVEILCDYLKRFHARSKLIMVFTDFSCQVIDPKQMKEAMAPFLQYKILFTDGKTVKKSILKTETEGK
ncbi:MAG: hypothetical protein ACI4AA_02220 [Lachnospiraceae bacterium]